MPKGSWGIPKRARTVSNLLRQDIGMAIAFIGAMGGDSERLFIPLLIIAVGAILVLWKEG